MAVYKRGYRRYQGGLTGKPTRFLVLPRFTWQRLLQQRLMIFLLLASIFWPLVCIGLVYLANHLELAGGIGKNVAELLKIDAGFFLTFMNVQSVFAVILAAFAGPSLIAPDLSNGALPLYFSRPLSRSEYVLARLLVLVGLLSFITWLPGLILFSLQAGMAGRSWFADHWNLSLGVFIGLLLWILLTSLIALAGSAYVRRRMIAGASVLGIFFVLSGASKLTNTILQTQWASVFNPEWAMTQIWRHLLGTDLEPGPGIWTCWLAVLAMTALLLFVLERKLRPVEVVS